MHRKRKRSVWIGTYKPWYSCVGGQLPFMDKFLSNFMYPERTQVLSWCNIFQAKLDFVHQLYQQLLTGRLLTHSPEGSTLGSFGWTDLTVLINEQVSLLLNTINRAEEKVSTASAHAVKRAPAKDHSHWAVGKVTSQALWLFSKASKENFAFAFEIVQCKWTQGAHSHTRFELLLIITNRSKHPGYN